jgi:NAD(P)-dependent dehydrogenase (short-subunit alcohol dehydrogenase family)
MASKLSSATDLRDVSQIARWSPGSYHFGKIDILVNNAA